MRALISDVHANLAALEAVVADAQAAGATSFISLGDIVGYNGEPDACISLLRQVGAINILGNHDSYITTGKNCERSRVVAAVIDRHRKEIGAENLSWLCQSIEMIREDSTLMVHGGPDDPLDQYVRRVDAGLFPTGIERLFVGHTHVQKIFHLGNKTFCNPGSVGQPRDGDCRAAYALLSEDNVILRRVAYDIDRTVNAMKDRGYEEFHYRGLYNGQQINGTTSDIELVLG
jgi:predicted phosphodiesterase